MRWQTKQWELRCSVGEVFAVDTEIEKERYLLLNFSGCFSLIMWNRWAMDASYKRRKKQIRSFFLCTPLYHHQCFVSFWQCFVRGLWRIKLVCQILSSSAVHLGFKILNLTKQLCEDEKTTDWGLHWMVSWWFYHGPLAINKSPASETSQTRDVFILKPDECILKPDKKTKFLSPHNIRAPITGLISLPRDWKQVCMHMYVC